MIYELDFEAVADVIAGAEAPITVILGKNGSNLSDLYSVVEMDEVADIADVFATGRLGTSGPATIFMDVIKSSYVGADEFAVIEGTYEELSDAAAAAGLEEIDTTACDKASYVTIDLLHDMMETREEVVAYVEIADGKVAFLPVAKDDVRNMFYGRHGAPTIRAYVNARNQVVIGEPVDAVAE